MTHTLPITKAREDLTKLVENASKKLDEYVITVNGTPAAVIISAAEYESLKETLEITSDPALMTAIREGEEDEKAGRVYDLEDVIKELGLQKDVQSKTHRKSKKRT